MDSTNNISGKVVWITGASSGIGKALAFECAKRGAKVALSARRAHILEKISVEITQAGGVAFPAKADVLNLDELKDTVERIENELGNIDILIANAGTHVFSIPENFDSKEYIDLMEINFGGTLRTIEAVLSKMIKRKSGYIVGVSSLSGYRGLPRAAAYGASKSALIHFLESIRFHLSEFNIFVSIVCPGFVKTPLTDKNDFPMPFLIDSSKAAEIICNGIQRHKKEISFPIPFNWFLKLTRILPYFIYEKIVFYLWRLQMKQAKSQ